MAPTRAGVGSASMIPLRAAKRKIPVRRIRLRLAVSSPRLEMALSARQVRGLEVTDGRCNNQWQQVLFEAALLLFDVAVGPLLGPLRHPGRCNGLEGVSHLDGPRDLGRPLERAGVTAFSDVRSRLCQEFASARQRNGRVGAEAERLSLAKKGKLEASLLPAVWVDQQKSPSPSVAL